MIVAGAQLELQPRQQVLGLLRHESRGQRLEDPAGRLPVRRERLAAQRVGPPRGRLGRDLTPPDDRSVQRAESSRIEHARPLVGGQRGGVAEDLGAVAHLGPRVQQHGPHVGVGDADAGEAARRPDRLDQHGVLQPIQPIRGNLGDRAVPSSAEVVEGGDLLQDLLTDGKPKFHDIQLSTQKDPNSNGGYGRPPGCPQSNGAVLAGVGVRCQAPS